MFRSKPMVHGGRPLITIDYNYKTQKFLSFIVTEDKGIKNSVIRSLSKYPDQFYNFSIRPVDLPLIMSKLFGSVIDVDTHKKKAV